VKDSFAREKGGNSEKFKFAKRGGGVLPAEKGEKGFSYRRASSLKRRGEEQFGTLGGSATAGREAPVRRKKREKGGTCQIGKGGSEKALSLRRRKKRANLSFSKRGDW